MIDPNATRARAFSRLSPLQQPGSQPPSGENPPPPEDPNSGDSYHASTACRVGGAALLALSIGGLAAGIMQAPPQVQVQHLQSPPRQTWITTAQEEKLGDYVAQSLEKQYKVWENPEQQQRLERIGNLLATTSSRQDIHFSFKILDTPMINAMALPGGKVYATRGLMENFKDDGQLNFVLGHEIAHVEQRHSVNQLGTTLLRAVVTAPLHFRQGHLGRFALAEGDKLIHNRYSQPLESEADRIGQQHLVRMGISPYKAVEAMEHLQSLTQGKDEIPERLEQIFSDHPPTRERIQDLRTWAGQISQAKN